ncbi:hypothetical protein H072_417 [Dactylellina haptotyla CBS 200.50]|uniref:AA9 family lytic polysaccharide monooxygenase n=1 Tax=Dactylellina haptotyla (strain CBS 200.50) TaxID=1284197 RepID=S8C1I0_DACHA|nr:hypothetical protein H072_417 [Dactylellina haptotyla CBS 200.50]
MRFSNFIAVASFSSIATAHTRIGKVWVNAIDQGDGAGVYIRQPPTNNPLLDVTSTDMICNVNNNPLSGYVNAKSGDTITLQWFKENMDPSDIVIDASHVGPVTVYMADMSLSATGQGAIWTKVYQDGQVGSSWALTRLREDPVHGKQVFTIPPKLKTGTYLVRAEIIALHEAYDVGKAQFYPSCSQFKITGPSDGVALPGGFNFAGGYSATDPSIHIDVYAGVTNYKVPGPAVWSNAAPVIPIGQSGGGTNPTTFRTSTTKSATTVAVPTTTGGGSGSGCVADQFAQCGGSGWTGCTKCPSGTTCQAQNQWYSQCLP